MCKSGNQPSGFLSKDNSVFPKRQYSHPNARGLPKMKGVPMVAAFLIVAYSADHIAWGLRKGYGECSYVGHLQFLKSERSRRDGIR